ncbi:MAG TPA: hypothetical protein VE983_02530 [Solirubrobacteraceae bacterium]|nr:hypothetical protein [Solirubrobacteraceae bacterium]
MTTLVLAASEPSKVPFYIAGALLVIWAVALAGVGMTVPAFPYNRRGQAAVIAVSLLLAAATVGTAIGTS